jgi:hypothetical protein
MGALVLSWKDKHADMELDWHSKLPTGLFEGKTVEHVLTVDPQYLMSLQLPEGYYFAGVVERFLRL